jgi:hypothetical protein
MPSLVTNESLRCLYDEASDPKGLEHETTKFWMAILNGAFPASSEIYCVQEVPPASASRKKVDAKVYCYVNGVQRCLIYVEFKRPGGFTKRLRRTAQRQVHEYCQMLLRKDTNVSSIYAMLCHGANVAFWTVQRDEPLPENLESVDANKDEIGPFKRSLTRIRRPRGSS